MSLQINGINNIHNQNNINQAQKVSSMNQGINFTDVFDQAMTSSVASTSEFNPHLEKKRNEKTYLNAKTYFEESKSILTAQLQGDPQILDNSSERTSTVPVQILFNRLIDNLNEISYQEKKVNTLIEGFIIGQVSEDEVVLETAKLNLMMSMITTLVQTGVQTFKEILQIPV